MKLVPGVSVPDREQQLKILRDRLTGHEAFGRVRGTVGEAHNASIYAILNGMIEGADSPTQFRERWQQYSGDVCAVGNILAQLDRDGMMEAATELRHALRDRAYLIAGEERDVPLHERVPITILVADFPATLDMIRWIRGGHWHDLDNYLDGAADSPDQRYALVQNLFRRFPSLEKYTTERRGRHDYEGWDLIAAHRDDTLGVIERADLPQRSLHPCELLWQSYNDHLEIHRGAAFAFICYADQATVLQGFTREQQSLISTWQCSVPRVMVSDHEWSRNLRIGFHPEADHAKWTSEPGFFASAGCQHEYGVVIWHANRFDAHTYGREHYTRYSMCQLDGVTPASPFCYVVTMRT